MNSEFIKKSLRSPLFIIAVLVCVANWQLLFCVKSLQWDVINFWHPWRYFIADCYNNGIIPLWDPYTQAGYPVHGDLQGPAYNPETIASSFLFNGSLYYLNYLFIGYLVLGAYGFYKLSSLFTKLVLKNDELNNIFIGPLVAGIVYALSGYNTGFGHYLYITVSVGLIPWIYYYFIKILNKGSFLDASKLAVFVLLQVTAGNPSFLIVSGYFFIAIAFIQFIRWIKQKESKKILSTIKFFSVSLILMIILCLPVLINAYYIFPETTRGTGIGLAWAAEERFALRNFFSLFTPLVGLEREYQSGTNQPIFDYYIGLTTLFFALVGFIKYRSFWTYIFSVIALVAFLLSIGLRTPLFGWFHGYLPGFNVFRMPRLIFLYDQLFLLLMAALGINYILLNRIATKWFLIFVAFCFSASIASVLYFKFYYTETGSYTVDYSSLRYYLWSEGQYPKALISCFVSGATLLVSLLLYWRKKTKLILFVLLADVMINYSVNAIARNFSETDAVVTNSYVKNTPKGFAVPENIVAGKVRTLTRHYNEFWHNTTILIKQPCYANDNNFELSNYMKLYQNNQTELNYFLQQPLAFFADSLVRKIDSLNMRTNKTLAIVDSASFVKYGKAVFSKSVSDTIVFEKFEPQQIVLKVRNEKNSALVLQQNLSKLTHIYMDGGEIKPDLCFYSFPFIQVSPGEHKIEFSYQVPHFRLFFGISILVFIIIVFFVLVKFKNKRIALLSFSFLILFCSFKFYTGGKSRGVENIKELQQEVLDDKDFDKKVFYCMNTRDSYFSSTGKPFNKFNFLYQEDVAGFVKRLTESTDEYLYYVNYKSYGPAEVEVLIKTIFGEEVKSKNNEFGFVKVYKRNPQKQFILYEKDFEIKKSNPDGIEVKKGKEYSPTFEFKVSDIGVKKYDLIFSEAEVECSFADFKGLCVTIDNDGKNKRFIAYNFIHHPNEKKQRLCFYYRFPEKTVSGDVVKIFLWNDDERPLLLREFKIKVISSNAF